MVIDQSVKPVAVTVDVEMEVQLDMTCALALPGEETPGRRLVW